MVRQRLLSSFLNISDSFKALEHALFLGLAWRGSIVRPAIATLQLSYALGTAPTL